jgi:protein-tyrosine kinase
MLKDVSPRVASNAGIVVPVAAALTAVEPDTELLRENGLVGWETGIESRSVNLLRAQVRKRLENRNINIIGVTSAEPDAGKSFVTANLALALSRIDGQQVLLFDFDLRRPTLARRMGIDSPIGMESWLAGETNDLQAIGRRFGTTGLAVFPVISQHAQASELISTARFDDLMGALADLPKSTIVLCDLPPAFVSDDAMTVVERLHAYIHVVEEGVTPRRQAEELRAMLEPAECLGVVLNRYAGRWNDSYGYYAARKYARYYDDPKT